MRRVALIVIALALLSPLSAAALQAGPGVSQTGGNATANASADMAPGAHLAGVVGSQGARIDGEVEQRAFSVRLERANSTAAEAATVAAVVGGTNATLGELRTRLDELRAAREAGNVTESTYRARVAVLAQRIASARELANHSAEAAADIPDAALRERGVSAAAARNLSRRAAKLGGPEVAAIARNVTGRANARPAGPPAGVGEPDAGPPNRTVPGNGEPPEAGDAGMNDSRDVSENDTRAVGPPSDARDTDDTTVPPNASADDGNGSPGASNASGSGGGSAGRNTTGTPPELGENAERNRSA